MPSNGAAPSDLELETDSGYIPRELRDKVALPRSTRERWHDEAKRLFRPTKNGYNDALSHLFLIDTLLRLKPEQLIRSANLRDLLAKSRPQVLWDSVTVGRMLNELTDIANEQRTAEQSAFLVTGRDGKGQFYVLSPVPATYQWLMDLRNTAYDNFQQELEYLEKGLPPPTRTFSVFEQFKGTQRLPAGFWIGGGLVGALVLNLLQNLGDVAGGMIA